MKSFQFRTALAIALSVIVLSCGNESTENPTAGTQKQISEMSCTEIFQMYGQPLQENAIDPSDPIYRVVYPNGGESFKAGSEITVVITSKKPGRCTVNLAFFKDGVLHELQEIPDAPRYGLDPQQECSFAFKIPAQFPDGFAAVSSQVKVRVADYELSDYYSDESDGYFSIAE